MSHVHSSAFELPFKHSIDKTATLLARILLLLPSDPDRLLPHELERSMGIFL
ncbi:hypothetical protein HanIR_Chr13g0641581 [Helianthus annuus]|nr:hypothetical protein HanIR_Chr13g0641581 [Helianthus annuus]